MRHVRPADFRPALSTSPKPFIRNRPRRPVLGWLCNQALAAIANGTKPDKAIYAFFGATAEELRLPDNEFGEALRDGAHDHAEFRRVLELIEASA